MIMSSLLKLEFIAIKSNDCNVHDPWLTYINEYPVPEGIWIGRT